MTIIMMTTMIMLTIMMMARMTMTTMSQIFTSQAPCRESSASWKRSSRWKNDLQAEDFDHLWDEAFDHCVDDFDHCDGNYDHYCDEDYTIIAKIKVVVTLSLLGFYIFDCSSFSNESR